MFLNDLVDPHGLPHPAVGTDEPRLLGPGPRRPHHRRDGRSRSRASAAWSRTSATHIGGDKVTLADLAGHRATLLQGPRFVGTGSRGGRPDGGVDRAPSACDGFIIAATHTPGAYEDVVRLVVPELQRRGVFRDRYTGDHPPRAPGHRTAGRSRPWLTRRPAPRGCGWWTPPPWPPARWWPRPCSASSAPTSSRWSSPGRATPCAPGATARTASGWCGRASAGTSGASPSTSASPRDRSSSTSCSTSATCWSSTTDPAPWPAGASTTSRSTSAIRSW